MIDQPEFLLIAGPNGAGKTTFVNTFLPEVTSVREFVNADLIAKGISPFNASSVEVQAGRMVVNRVSKFIADRIPFALETTLSGSSYSHQVIEAKRLGFIVKLYYIYLNSPELSLQRIADRVRKGGHDVPSEVVLRRYERSLRNCFRHCIEAVDSWQVIDNSTSEFRPIASGDRSHRIFQDKALYNTLNEKYGAH